VAETRDVDQRLCYRRGVLQGVPSSNATADLPAPSAISSSEQSFEGPREIVIRPDGMRKGVWEAPSAFFWVAASVLGVIVVAWVLFRFGFVKMPKRKPKPKEEAPPKSKRSPAKEAKEAKPEKEPESKKEESA